MKLKKLKFKKLKSNKLFQIILILFGVFIFFIGFSFFSNDGDNIIVTEKKKDFFVNIKSFNDFTNTTNIKKTGKLTSSQNISLTSNARGRILDINIKEGDKVVEGQPLASLEDNIGSYKINLERSRNGLERASISLDSNKINLDKQIFDAALNLERLEKNLSALMENSKEDLKKAESDLNNTDTSLLNSKSTLELKKIDNSILKAELDYDNKIILDNEAIEGFKSTIKKEHNSILILMDDIIEFGDSLFGVTYLHDSDDKVRKVKDFLGGKDTGQKNITKKLLLDLILYRNSTFKGIKIVNLTENELITSLDNLNIGYDKIKVFLNSFEDTINNSISSEGSLGLADISGYLSKINIYQGTLQGNYTGFLAYNNSVKSFLRTYKKAEESILKQIGLLKEDREIALKSFNIGYDSSQIGYNKTIININDSINNLELQVKSARNTLENAKKAKNVTLRNLQNGINEANIGYKQSLKEYKKLFITSPISGTIGSIFIDVGQEVNIGTPVFSILSTGNNEVQISFNKNEINKVFEGKEIFMVFEGKSYSGSIYSISKTADQNLKYISRLSFDSSIKIIGNIVSVYIPIDVEYKLVPMNIIKINNSGYGIINILKDGKIEQLSVKLGKIYNDKIEIIDNLDENTKIITNYVDNFDSEKFILKIKK